MSYPNTLPPLIDRDAFFGEIKISGAEISPNGEYVAFLKPHRGARNIWVKKTEEPFEAARPLTAETERPVPAFFWTRDSRFILYVQDQAGDENYNLYAVDPSAAPAAATGVPAARDLTQAKGSRAEIVDRPRRDPDLVYVALNDRDKAWHDLYRLRISTGERTLIRKNTERIPGWVFDNASNLRLALRTTDAGDTEILRIDGDAFTTIYTCSVFETCQPVKFDPANEKVYLITNKGAADLIELALLDPVAGDSVPVDRDPLNHVDLEDAMFSDFDDRLIATIYNDDRERIYFRDAAFEADYKWLSAQHPGKEFHFGSHTADERVWVVSATSDTEPGETYIFNRDAKTLTLQYRIREQIPRAALAEMRAIHYPSSDGMEIPAYLTLPKGVEPKNLPLVLFPHGGPWARDEWRYHPFAQFFANRGYALLQPNFRSSTGFGKAFLNAGNGEWGRKMQDDLTWGVRHLVETGVVDSKRVGIAGGSYGGYATLAGVTFTPDLYAAAVAIVAPSDLLYLLQSIPPYWEAGRKIMYARMADPGTAEGRELLEQESPLHFADRIRTPLMVVQGANDPRVKKRNSDEIVVALRQHGIPVEYLVAPDEGHGFARPINNLALVAAMEKFFAEHLGGRYQEDMPEEVSKRLREITVDPAAVELPPAIDPAQVTAPVPATDLKPVVRKYRAQLNMGAESLSLAITSEVKDQDGCWAAIQTLETPMGTAIDTVVLTKQTLLATEQTLRQGPIEIHLNFSDATASGDMTIEGQSTPVSIQTGGPLFAQGPAGIESICALPLAPGYKTAFRNLDLQMQQPKLLQLGVSREELVADTRAWRVEVMSAEGGPDRLTLWVAKDSRTPLKYEMVASEMGGAVISAERID